MKKRDRQLNKIMEETTVRKKDTQKFLKILDKKETIYYKTVKAKDVLNIFCLKTCL